MRSYPFGPLSAGATRVSRYGALYAPGVRLRPSQRHADIKVSDQRTAPLHSSGVQVTWLLSALAWLAASGACHGPQHVARLTVQPA